MAAAGAAAFCGLCAAGCFPQPGKRRCLSQRTAASRKSRAARPRNGSAESVAAKMQALNDALKAHGVAEDIGIFMTLAFVSLPVIPKLRLNTYGIIDVAQQKVVPAVF